MALTNSLNIRKILIVVVSVVFLAAVAFNYFVKVIPKKEQELNQRGFRILSRMDQNLHDKRDNVLFTVDEVYSRLLPSERSDRNSFEGLNPVPERITREKWKALRPDSARLGVTYDRYTNRWIINFFGDHRSINKTTLTISDKVSKDSIDMYNFESEKFFADILQYRNDFFEDYIVVLDESVLYQTKSLSHGKTKTTDPTQHPNTDCIVRDTLSGQAYYVFIHPMSSNSDIRLKLCGLISVDSYDNQKKAIDPSWAIWITLAGFLGLFSISFIKPIMVSPFERIQYSDVIKMCISLVAGGAVLATVFMMWMLSTAEVERQKRMLRLVNNEVQQRIQSELRDVIHEIRHQQSLFSYTDYNSWLSKNTTVKKGTDGPLVFPYFNLDCSFHETEAFLLIDKRRINWATWMVGNKPYPDLILKSAEFPSLDSTDKRHHFRLPFDGYDHEDYGFQLINAWSKQRNSILVSVAADSAARAAVQLLSDKAVKNSKSAEKAFKEKLKNTAYKSIDPVDLAIVAVETKLFSVTEPALPAEIQFAVLDANGDVIFHSNSRRNLRENFIEECNNQAIVREAIKSRMDTTLRVRYFGSEHQAYFSAIPAIPLTVVTLYDSTTYLDSMLNGATFTMTMLLILTVIISLIFIVAMVMTRQITLLKRQTVNLKWIRLTTINRDACKLLIWLHISIVLLSAIALATMTTKLLIAFTIPILAIALTGAVLFAYNEDRYKSGLYSNTITNQFRIFFALCFCAQFMNGLIAFKGPHHEGSEKAILFIISLLILLGLVYNPSLFRLSPGKITLFRLSPGNIRYYLHWKILVNPRLIKKMSLIQRIKKSDKNNVHDPEKASVIVWAMLWLVFNVSVFPTGIFFYNAVKQEAQVVEKRNSMHLATAIAQRQEWLSKTFGDYTISHEQIGNTALLDSGIYTLNSKPRGVKLLKDDSLRIAFDSARIDMESENRSQLVRELYSTIVNLPNLSWDAQEATDMFTHRNASDDSTAEWRWTNQGSYPKLIYRYSKPFGSTAFDGIEVELKMFRPPFIVFDENQLMVIVIGLVVFFGIYRMIFFTYKKLTLLEYFNRTTIEQIRVADTNYIENIFKNFDSNNLIVISLPGTDVETKLVGNLTGYTEDKTKFMSDPVKNTPITIPHKRYKPAVVNGVPPTNGVEVVILPFFDLSTLDNLTTALNDFSILLEDTTRKIIWITSADPCEQVAALGKKMVRVAKENGTNTDATVTKAAQERENLLRILDEFKKINYRLEDNTTTPPKDPISLTHVEEEFAFGSYFKRLRTTILSSGTLDGYYKRNKNNTIVSNVDDRSDDLFVLKIQDMAQNYYFSIWATLSFREKYVLYDLAQDELTNHKNYPTLVELERKGILFFCEKENALKIFNKSFRNFILTVVDPDEALMLRKEINTEGTWSVIRTILIVLGIGIGTFIFIEENWFYHQLLFVFGGIAVIAPAVINFFDNGLRQLWTRKSSNG